MLKIIQISPTKLDTSLSLMKDLIKPRFPEKPFPENPQGAKRLWDRWLIVALALIKQCLSFSWREYTALIKEHESILQGYGALKAPSMSTIYNEWKSMPISQLENLVKLTGKILSPDPKSAAFDSSGFLFKGGSVWILLKWGKMKLKKTSRAFYKAHIAVDVESTAVLAVKLSKSNTADVIVAWKLLLILGMKILSKLGRIYGDKAYNDKKLRGRLDSHNVRLIVEPKKNATDKGTNDFQDRNLRLYRNSPNLWKSTHNYNQKTFVELVFGTIKSKPIPLSAKLAKNKKKQIIVKFFVYNFNMMLEMENLR